MVATKQRPWGVIVLTVLAVIAGLWDVWHVLLSLRILTVNFGPFNFFGQGLFGALTWGILALIWFTVARWLWRLEPSGWLFVVLTCILNLIMNFVSWIGGAPVTLLGLNTLLPLIALLIAALPSTRAAYGR